MLLAPPFQQLSNCIYTYTYINIKVTLWFTLTFKMTIQSKSAKYISPTNKIVNLLQFASVFGISVYVCLWLCLCCIRESSILFSSVFFTFFFSLHTISTFARIHRNLYRRRAHIHIKIFNEFTLCIPSSQLCTWSLLAYTQSH